MTYTYKIKIPEIFSKKKYDFIFIGYEINDELVRRNDIPYTNEFIYETFDGEIDKIVFLAYKDDNWDENRVEYIARDYIVKKYDDVVLPIYDKHKNIEINPHEFNEKITVVFIDEGHHEEIDKIIHMYNCIGITNIKIINSKTVDMDPIRSLQDYDKFAIKELHKYIDTEFVLISQWDGFIIDYNRIKRDFLKYDYIGAPLYKNTGAEIGNGGFSLRSKKFLDTVSGLFKDYEIDDQEDQFLQKHIKKLKKANLKFAPWYIKDSFSVELLHYSGQFGFHGWMTRGLPEQAKQFYKNKFHHSGDLGDLIFGLPTMKALGGGILYISNDTQYFKTRSWFTKQVINQLKELLRYQDYIVEVYVEERMPCDVDYDLNKFRRRQLLSFCGVLDTDEKPNFDKYWKNTTITKLHLEEFNCDLKADIEPWLKWHKKTVYENKPIIINRTTRYQNPQFPWRQICKKYGDYIYFVGTTHEYKSFVEEFGHVDFLNTPTITSLVEAIIGCKLLIGNMSFPVALAEGFKHNCLVESGIDVRSNNYDRHNIFIPDPDNIIVNDTLNYIEEYVGF